MEATPFFRTKKFLTLVAAAVAVVAWFISKAAKLELPWGISKDDALAGLASIGTFLGILGASPLPGGTLLKGKGGPPAAVLLPFVALLGMARVLFLLIAAPVVFFIASAGVLATPGCATLKPVTNDVVNLMPKVHTYVEDGGLVISAVEGIEQSYFQARPNPDLQKKVEILIANAKTALRAGLKVCEATEHLSNSNIVAAFADFRGLYTDIVALLEPYGARRDGAMGAGAGPPGPDLALPDPPLLMGVKG